MIRSNGLSSSNLGSIASKIVSIDVMLKLISKFVYVNKFLKIVINIAKMC